MGWNTLDLPGARIATVDSSMVFPLGTKCAARDTSNGYYGEFVYMKGAASVAAGNWCLLNYDNGTVSLLADNDIGGVGVAMGAIIASTYGWFQIRGKAEAALAASCADNATLYTTSTAGVADDTATSMTEILGAKGAETISSAGNAEVELNYPTVTTQGG